MIPASEGPLVRVLVIREDGGFTAQMLEMDFAARGATVDEALRSLSRTVLGQARLDRQHGRSPFTDRKTAPQHFWDTWRTIEWDASDAPNVPPAHVVNAALKSSSYQLQW